MCLKNFDSAMNNETRSLRYPINKSAQPLGKHAVASLTHGTCGIPRKEGLPTQRIAPVKSRALPRTFPSTSPLPPIYHTRKKKKKKKKPLASHINTYTLDAAAKPQMFSNKQRPLESHTFDQSQKKREQ